MQLLTAEHLEFGLSLALATRLKKIFQKLICQKKTANLLCFSVICFFFHSKWLYRNLYYSYFHIFIKWTNQKILRNLMNCKIFNWIPTENTPSLALSVDKTFVKTSLFDSKQFSALSVMAIYVQMIRCETSFIPHHKKQGKACEMNKYAKSIRQFVFMFM